jgi:hypothetical protein
VNLSASGIARTMLATAAGAGLVVAAMQTSGAVVLAQESGGHADSATSVTSPVRGASLVCPGPELKGVPGIDDLPVGVRVAAVTAPLRALPGTQPSSQPGQLLLTGMPGGSLGKPLTTRGPAATADLTKAQGAVASATESLAPGLAAAQSWLVASGDRRSLGSASCGQAGAEFWILAGGSAPGRQERIVLTNPGGNAVTVDLTLHGQDGPLASPNGKGIVVPAHGRTAFLLDSISSELASPVVHVVAQGGVVAAVVNDVWLDGTRAGGADDAVPSAAPSRDQVVPAVAVAGRAALRVVVPGANEAVVQARVLTAQGARALPAGGVIRIDGGAVRDIDLSKLPPGAVALQVRADVPVVAAVTVAREAPGKPGDFAWSPSTAPIVGVAGMPLVDPPGTTAPLSRALALTSSGETAEVEVVTVDAKGVEKSQKLQVGVDASVALDLRGAASVWVHRVSGQGAVRAGVLSWTKDAQGTLITATPLQDAVLHTTTVGLRDVTP